MLKIKDNVDLKELEKFGFEKCCDWYRYEIENMCIGISTIDRIIQISYCTADAECGYMSDLEPLFDLIRAGLVERVG